MASRGARARPPGNRGFLPPDPRVEEPYRFTPQLALRIGILAAVALVVFGILFFRLWALQVLSGPRYLKAAQDNQIRSVRIEAQRGEIFDRSGHPLVATVPGTAVQLWPADLAEGLARSVWPSSSACRWCCTSRSARCRGDEAMRQRPGNAGHGPRVGEPRCADHLPARARRAVPGVRVVNTYLRSYTYGSLAAQLLGTSPRSRLTS